MSSTRGSEATRPPTAPAPFGTAPPLGTAPAPFGTAAATALVALGGALGVLLRYALSGWLEAALGSAGYSTLAINVAGAFALGLAVEYLGHNHRWFPLVGPGVLGGFTTYSSLAVSAVLLSGGAPLSLGATLAYAVGSLVAGLLAAVAGLWVGERLGDLSGRPRSEEPTHAERGGDRG